MKNLKSEICTPSPRHSITPSLLFHLVIVQIAGYIYRLGAVRGMGNRKELR